MQYLPVQVYLTGNPDETFWKKRYVRHSDAIGERRVYPIVNNRVIIERTDEMLITSKIWFSNVSNIKSVTIYMINDFVDPDSLQVDMPATNNVYLLHRLTKESLLLYNKLCKNDSIEFPVTDTEFCPGIFNDTRLVFVFSLIDSELPCHLKIKYLNIVDLEMKMHIRNMSHEYLFKRLTTVKYKISPGNNVIDPDMKNSSLSYLTITAPKGTSDSLNIQLGDTRINLSSTDQEYNGYTIDECDTYIYDVFGNIPIKFQPTGDIILKDCFNIFSMSETEIQITYATNNVMRSVDGVLAVVYNESVTNAVSTAAAMRGGYRYLPNLLNRIINKYTLEQIDTVLADAHVDIDTANLTDSIRLALNGELNDITDILQNATGTESNIHVAFIFCLGAVISESEIGAATQILYDVLGDFCDLNNLLLAFRHKNYDINALLPPVQVPVQMPVLDHGAEIDAFGPFTEPNMNLLYDNLIYKYECSTAINRSIKNESCCISWSDIKYNDYYYKCDDCTAIFEPKLYKKWLRSNTKCPQCSRTIERFPQIYRNRRGPYVLVATAVAACVAVIGIIMHYLLI